MRKYYLVMGSVALIMVVLVAVTTNIEASFTKKLAGTLVALMYGGIGMFHIWADGIRETAQPRAKRLAPCLALWFYEAIVSGTILIYGGWHEHLMPLTVVGVVLAVFFLVAAFVTYKLFKKE